MKKRSERVRKILERHNEAREYVEGLGYELGTYSFRAEKITILKKDVNAIDGCKEIVGYCDVENKKICDFYGNEIELEKLK